MNPRMYMSYESYMPAGHSLGVGGSYPSYVKIASVLSCSGIFRQAIDLLMRKPIIAN